MEYYDISVPLSNTMHNWPTNDPIEIEIAKTMEEGASSNVTNIQINSHTGTHVDAPHHMLPGTATIDQVPIDQLIGPVQVIQIGDPEKITGLEIKQKINPGAERVIFKTNNSDRWSEDKFFDDYIYLTTDGAEVLIENKVKSVGIDYLSIDRFGDNVHLPHKKLLSSNAIILEGLNLLGVPAGDYQQICLPLKIRGADGAPARVILKKGE